MSRTILQPRLLTLFGLIFAASGCERTTSSHTNDVFGGAGQAGEAGAFGAGGAGASPSSGGTGATGSIECSEGTMRCEGRVPERCTEAGQWAAVQAACAAACLDGQCVECAEGETDCRDDAAIECRGGVWQTAQVCEGTCEDAACVDQCTEDRLQCNGQTRLQICQSGEYVDHETCEFLCREGECTGNCTPDAKRCDPQAPEQAQTCNTSGEWDASVPCADGLFCVDGDCKPCEPGTERCAATGPQLCSDAGEWVPQGACSEPMPVCFEGECVTCDPGDRRCEGNTLMVCADDGSDWNELEVCSGATPACLESTQSCGRCVEDQTQCLADAVQVCDDSGAWQDMSSCSGTTAQCVEGACAECDPAANERRCLDDSTVQVCESDGTWGATTTCSGDMPLCREALNFSCGCQDGERRCRNATTPELCTGGQWVAQTACSGTTPVCDTDSNTCVTCASQECVLAPAGWQGPVVLSSGTQADPPSCPGSAPTTSFQAFTGLDVPSSQCGCTCQSVPLSQQSCSDVEIGPSSAPCSSEPVLLVTMAPEGGCTNFSGNLFPGGQFQFLSITPSEWSASAGCTPQPSASIPALEWDAAHVACELPTSCQSTGKCAPELGAGEQLCVYASGNVQCPTGFPNRVDTWQGANDTRSCSNCSCGEPTGTCSGEVVFRDADCMPFRDELASLSIDFCHGFNDALSGTAARGAVGEFGPSGGSCTPANSTPQGSATATGRRTVCCQ